MGRRKSDMQVLTGTRSLKRLDEKVLSSRSKYCLLKQCGEGMTVGPMGVGHSRETMVLVEAEEPTDGLDAWDGGGSQLTHKVSVEQLCILFTEIRKE